ncbi:MAG: hypothetical protein RI957_1536 [Verrucomicrobiota bacterium]|jgi:hypothetical protein
MSRYAGSKHHAKFRRQETKDKETGTIDECRLLIFDF